MLMKILRVAFHTSLLLAMPYLCIRTHKQEEVIVPMLLGLLYVFGYVIAQGALKDIASRIVISLVLAALAAAIPPLVVLLFLWMLYNLIETAKGAVALLPYFLVSMTFCGLAIGGMDPRMIEYQSAILGAYFIVALVFSWRIGGDPLGLGLFKLSLMMASGPLLLLTIVAMASAIKSMFEIRVSIGQRSVRTPQQVSGYMRGGTAVSGYTRMVSGTVTQATHSIVAGSGVFTAAATGAGVAAIGNDEGRK